MTSAGQEGLLQGTVGYECLEGAAENRAIQVGLLAHWYVRYGRMSIGAPREVRCVLRGELALRSYQV